MRGTGSRRHVQYVRQYMQPIGALVYDPAKTYRPFTFALANVAAPVWMSRAAAGRFSSTVSSRRRQLSGATACCRALNLRIVDRAIGRRFGLNAGAPLRTSSIAFIGKSSARFVGALTS